MITTELGTVEIRLPFKYLGFTVKKKVGFRYNILAWSIVSDLAGIEFHEIDELQKTRGLEMFEMLVLAGAKAYEVKYGNPKVTTKDVKRWIYEIPAREQQRFVNQLNIALLNSKMMGKTMTELLTEQGEKKN